MDKAKRNKRILVSLVNGIGLFICLWYINNSSYTTFTDEDALTKVNNIEQYIYSNKWLKKNYNFVFIDVSRDLDLMNDPVQGGQITITDRKKLTSFFQLLADNHNLHRFVLCDLFFEFPTNDDSALLYQINRCTHLLFPSHLENNLLIKPCIPVNTAIANYETYSGRFAKFQLLYKDSIETIPVKMMHELNGAKKQVLQQLNTISPCYFITAKQLQNHQYPFFQLGDLLESSNLIPDFYNKFLKNKFVIIGNFETDVHETPVGKTPGTLILLDVYLTLVAHKNISWLWVLFMIASLSCCSYLVFYKKVQPIDHKHPVVDLVLQLLINDYISYFGICLLMVIISELLFSTQIVISPILVYFICINFIVKFLHKHYLK